MISSGVVVVVLVVVVYSIKILEYWLTYINV